MINYKWLQQRTCLVTSLKYFQESEGMGILFQQNGDLHDMVVFWVFIFFNKWGWNAFLKWFQSIVDLEKSMYMHRVYQNIYLPWLFKITLA